MCVIRGGIKASLCMRIYALLGVVQFPVFPDLVLITNRTNRVASPSPHTCHALRDLAERCLSPYSQSPRRLWDAGLTSRSRRDSWARRLSKTLPHAVACRVQSPMPSILKACAPSQASGRDPMGRRPPSTQSLQSVPPALGWAYTALRRSCPSWRSWPSAPACSMTRQRRSTSSQVGRHMRGHLYLCVCTTATRGRYVVRACRG